MGIKLLTNQITNHLTKKRWASLTKDFVAQGKRNRRKGKHFEIVVRQDLEKKGWLVFRNSNDVVEGVFRQAKSKWNPFTKMPMTMQSGFPDFLIVRRQTCGNCVAHGFGDCGWTVQFVECKTGKYLSKEEKEKVEWIKTNLKIQVSVSYKGKKRGVIEYEEA
jgi:hypothetical protein